MTLGVDRLHAIVDAYGDRHLPVVAERVRSGFARQAPVIFGAGQNGRLVASMLRESGIEPSAFADDTPAKVGTEIEGLRVFTLGEAVARWPGAPFVVSVFHPSHEYSTTAGRLRNAGVEPISLFEAIWACGKDRLPFYFVGDPSDLLANVGGLEFLLRRLADPFSIDLLCRQVEFRLSLRADALPGWQAARMPPPPEEPQWTYVDAGAFDGDTLIPFHAAHPDRIARAVAIEPDPITFGRLRANVAAAGPGLSDAATLVHAAVDRESGERTFASTAGLASSFAEDGGERITTYAIDDLLQDLDVSGAIYLKLDVEGSEGDVLAGARKTLANPRTLAAVAAYHKPDDIWALPRLIADIRGDCSFALRCHGGDGADLMIYALPAGDGRSGREKAPG